MLTSRPSDWFPTSKIGTDSSPVVFMLRDARDTGARGVIARGDGKGKGEMTSSFPFSIPITPRVPVPRASRNMKTTGDESEIGSTASCL